MSASPIRDSYESSDDATERLEDVLSDLMGGVVIDPHRRHRRHRPHSHRHSGTGANSLRHARFRHRKAG